MTFEALVVKALIGLGPAWGTGEPLPEWWTRMHEVGVVIANEARARSKSLAGARRLAAMLVAVGHHETRFSERFALGRCRPGECDGGRARGYYQLWRVSCRRLFAVKVGSAEALRVSTGCAARLLDVAWLECRKRSGRGVYGALSRYAVGHGCSWSGAERRRETYDRVLGVLEDGG